MDKVKVRVLQPYKVITADGMAKVGDEVEMSIDVAKRLQRFGVVKIIEPINQEAEVEKKAKTKSTGRKRGRRRK